MIFKNLNSSLRFDLKNCAQYITEKPAEYREVLSPFSRIYLIQKGSGFIYYNNNKIELEPGYMYLIPSYVFCTYSFNPGMAHYYLHFINSLEGGFNLYDLFYCNPKVKARNVDIELFDELVTIHPDLKLINNNPEVYQNKTWIHKEPDYHFFGDYLLTNSIIAHLLSRFICSDKKMSNEFLTQREMLKPILAHIFENLQHDIKVSDLANMASLSKDHFTRVFKKVTNLPPNEYINRKRVEKAQTLLVTTGMSQKEIIDKCGFNSLSYFSRMFTRYTKTTPGDFRRLLV